MVLHKGTNLIVVQEASINLFNFQPSQLNTKRKYEGKGKTQGNPDKEKHEGKTQKTQGGTRGGNIRNDNILKLEQQNTTPGEA